MKISKVKLAICTLSTLTIPFATIYGVSKTQFTKIEPDSSVNNVENKVDITSVVPANTDIGAISLLPGTTEPSSLQILNAINMWMQAQSTLPHWHINQVEVDQSTVTLTGATIKVAPWSPDYNASSTTVRFKITTIKQTTLYFALTGSQESPKEVDLNAVKAEALSKKTADEVDALKGDANKVKLLKWLNAADLYSSALYINQISVTSSLEFNNTTQRYQFTIAAKTNSNVYLTGGVKVSFNLSKTDISKLDLVKTLSFVANPTEDEIAFQFLDLNRDKLDPMYIAKSDLIITNIVVGGSCSVAVNPNNPTYTSSTPIVLTWTTTKTVDISTVITVTTIDAVTYPREDADIMFLVEEANFGKTIFWDDITIVLEGPATTQLKAKNGSLIYTGVVTINWNIL